jgi:hypothetical protein
MPQSSIVIDPAVAVAGMIADAARVKSISRACATAAGVAAGRGLSASGTAGKECKVLAASTDLTPGSMFLGFARKQFYTRESGSPDYRQRDEVDIVRQGDIWLTCSTAIALTDAITIVYSGADAGLPCVSGTANSAAIGIGTIALLIPPSGVGALGLFAINLP